MTGSAEILKKVKEGTARVIIGYEDIVEDFLICLASGGHILLEGVPGVAKTTIAKTVSTLVGLDFKRIQFTQDLLPADITGHFYFNQKNQEFEFRPGPIISNMVLADEINRAPSKTQSALLEAMEEKQVTVEGNTFKLEEPFLVIATINPVELEGVYTLPEAQMDRFMIKSKMDYLAVDDELRFLNLKNGDWKLESVSSIGENPFLVMKKEVGNCRADPSILRYIRDIITTTRTDDSVLLGASPRAGEHLLKASKAMAVLHGRDYVIPDDVKKVAKKLLPHRLTLTLDTELEGISAEMIIERIMERIDVVQDPSVKV